MKHYVLGAIALSFSAVATSTMAVEINYLDGSQGWFETDTRVGGEAAIVDLGGLGGQLETTAPLPSGALRLTTDGTNAAKAEVGLAGNFGTVSDLLQSGFSVSYSWFDSAGTAVAAPSLKLAFYNPAYTADPYGQLVFEPYWQSATGNSSITPPQGEWVTSTITATSGLMWNTSMFGVPSSAGGPPNRTLTDWINASDPAFLSAQLVGISIGIGTYNPSETGYVDNVRIVGTSLDGAYDFEAAPAVPVPASLPLLVMGALSLAGLRARRRKA